MLHKRQTCQKGRASLVLPNHTILHTSLGSRVLSCEWELTNSTKHLFPQGVTHSFIAADHSKFGIIGVRNHWISLTENCPDKSYSLREIVEW